MDLRADQFATGAPAYESCHSIVVHTQIPHAMFNLSITYMMFQPEHWCHVDGLELGKVPTHVCQLVCNTLCLGCRETRTA
jgi:hypothetical protein